MSQATSVLEQYTTYMEEISKSLQQAKDEGVVGPFLNQLKDKAKETLALHKNKDEPVLANTLTVEECTIADVKDEESVTEAFKTLFTKYPEDILANHPLDSEKVKEAYRQKGIEFSNDVMLEAYIVSRKLEERMEALREDYATLSSCYVDGKGGSGDSCQAASDTDDELGIWVNYYRINAIYDSLLRIAEELAALNAQYRAAQTLREGIEPIMPETEGNSKVEQDAYNLKIVEKMAFAQLMRETELKQEKQEQIVEEEQPKQNTKLLELRAALKPVKMAEKKVPSLLDGTDKLFQDMVLYEELYGKLSNAQSIHNLKVKMPSYREIFLSVRQMEKLHDEALKRLALSEQCAINYLGQFYTNPSAIWYGAGCSSQNGIITCNSGKKVSAEALQSLQKGSSLCGENNTEICTNTDFNRYADRGGFSGWLLSSYQTIKAEETLELTEDDYATPQADPSVTGNISEMDSLKQKVQAEQDSGTADNSFKRPSEEEAINQDLRAQELLAWHIGAEAAKAIGADMASESPKWGAVKTPYPLWEDEKYFYRTYLAEKYENIKLFIKNLDMRAAVVKITDSMLDSLTDGLINGLPSAQIKTYGKNAVVQLSKSFGDSENVTADFTELEKQINQNNQAMTRLKTEFENRLAALETSKKAVYSRLDDENIALSEQKENYNTLLNDKKKADISMQSQDLIIGINQNRMDKSTYATDVFANIAAADKATAEETSSQKQAESESALNGIDTKRENIDSLQAQIDDINNNIERAKSDYAAALASLELQNEQALEEALQAAQKTAPTLKGSDVLKQALNNLADKSSVKQTVFSGMIGNADSLIAEAKEIALKRVDEALEKLADMGDDLYNPANADQILKIHTDLMNDLQTPSLTSGLGVFEALINPAQVRNAAAEAYQKAFIAATCAKVDCDKPDAQYFVGLPPKAQDFTAPKKLAYTYTPPLREIVHFDTVDYDNVIKSDDEKLSRRALFEYGEDVPEIWHRILEPKAFVEKDFDVKAMLQSYDSGNSSALLNAGSYPCQAGNYGVGFMNGVLTLWPNKNSSLQACSDIEQLKIQPLGTVNISFKNGEKTTGKLNSGFSEKDAKSMCGYSELATLLSYDKGLTFSPKMKEIYKFFEEATEADEDGGYGAKGKVYENALLNRNQFGDYLNFVELEENYQNALDELYVKLDETRESLKKSLAQIDYVPEDDFDLADDATYNEIMNKLESAKNGIIAEVAPKIGTITPANEGLEENIEKLNNLVGALQLDKDEVVSLSDNMKGDSELSQKIKSQTVDNEAMSRYNKEAEDALEKEINNFGSPYCASFCNLSF